jgi:hypothetical protein
MGLDVLDAPVGGGVLQITLASSLGGPPEPAAALPRTATGAAAIACFRAT